MASDLTSVTIGDKLFDFSRPYLMGILNVTPDSFSDGGKFLEPSRALDHALRMQSEGADLIDIGGESTRPGSEPLALEVELERVIPVIERLAPKLNLPISIDTCKSEVARRAIDAGAKMINDISGLGGDPLMAPLVSERAVPVIIMHIQGTPKTMQQNPHYDDLMGEIGSYFETRIKQAEQAGIQRAKLILDPGLGFGKIFADNFRILKHLSSLKVFDLPILVGASRKRFLSDGDSYSADERLEQSLTAAIAAVQSGANILRVHDVLSTRKALWTLEQIQNSL